MGPAEHAAGVMGRRNTLLVMGERNMHPTSRPVLCSPHGWIVQSAWTDLAPSLPVRVLPEHVFGKLRPAAGREW